MIVGRPSGSFISTESSKPVKVTIAGADVENITLTMGPGVTLAGHVVTDGGTVPSVAPGGVRVSGTLADRATSGFGPTASAALNDDWTFQLAGVHAPVLLRLSGRLPEGWRLKSVFYRGAEVSDTATEFAEDSTTRELQIVISNRGAKVEGVVADAAGRSAPDRPVVLFPVESAPRVLGSTRVRTTMSDEQGRFKLEGLREGSYFLVALEGTMMPLIDRSVFEPLVRSATRVALAEDEQKTVNLRVGRLEQR